jgi:hypothetical protein
VLLRAGLQRSAPVQLSAAKSFMGHAEPAAGLVGVTRLALIMGQRSVDPLLHLTGVNPYVGSALATARPHGPASCMAAPRQPAAAAASGGPGAVAYGGVSSFAFQGTNAHALLGVSNADSFSFPGASAAALVAAGVHRSRFWVLPAAHPLAPAALPPRSKQPGGRVVFECSLLAPRLAIYADHVVMGRVLLPATAMLEAALAAGSVALEAYAGNALGVAGLAIAGPLIVPQPAAQSKTGTVMRCAVSPAAGAFTLSHASGRSGPRTDNASGHYCVAAAAAALATTLAAVAAGAVLQQEAARRAVLLGLLVPAKVAPNAGHAMGSIAVHPDLAGDGYIVPPSCMDACLHLGVSAPGCGAKVPVAAGAFACHAGREMTPLELLGSTSAAHAAPTAAFDVSSFALHSSVGGAGYAASLASIETKVLKPKAPAKVSIKPADFLYEVEWDGMSHPSKEAALVTTHGRGHRRQARLQVASAGLVLQAEVPLVAPHAAASAALGLVQAAAAQAGLAASVSASMHDVLPAGLARSAGDVGECAIAAGALEGLLRVAATEQATVPYALRTSDPHAPSTGLADSLLQLGSEGGSLGILQRERQISRALAAPRLVRSSAVAPGSEPLQIRPEPRGSLGSLVAKPFAAPLGDDDVIVSVKAVGINFRCACGYSARCSACTLVLPLFLVRAPVPVGSLCLFTDRACPLGSAETCSTCWVCTPETPALRAATAPAWCSVPERRSSICVQVGWEAYQHALFARILRVQQSLAPRSAPGSRLRNVPCVQAKWCLASRTAAWAPRC